MMTTPKRSSKHARACSSQRFFTPLHSNPILREGKRTDSQGMRTPDADGGAAALVMDFAAPHHRHAPGKAAHRKRNNQSSDSIVPVEETNAGSREQQRTHAPCRVGRSGRPHAHTHTGQRYTKRITRACGRVQPHRGLLFFFRPIFLLQCFFLPCFFQLCVDFRFLQKPASLCFFSLSPSLSLPPFWQTRGGDERRGSFQRRTPPPPWFPTYIRSKKLSASFPLLSSANQESPSALPLSRRR